MYVSYKAHEMNKSVIELYLLTSVFPQSELEMLFRQSTSSQNRNYYTLLEKLFYSFCQDIDERLNEVLNSSRSFTY